jgi:hypothetical protein
MLREVTPVTTCWCTVGEVTPASTCWGTVGEVTPRNTGAGLVTDLLLLEVSGVLNKFCKSGD